MSKSVKCPACGRELSSKPLKSWKFRFYDVKRCECQHCKTKFNAYNSPESTFTIPKAMRYDVRKEQHGKTTKKGLK
jgi:hypothetical protein